MVKFMGATKQQVITDLMRIACLSASKGVSSPVSVSEITASAISIHEYI